MKILIVENHDTGEQSLTAVGRNGHSQSLGSELLVQGSLQLNVGAAEVIWQGQVIHLTPKEYGILELLVRHPGQIFSRTMILDHVWKLGECPGERTVTTHIKGLRHKLTAAGLSGHWVESVYGLGYRWKVANGKQKTVQKSGISQDLQPMTQELANLMVLWDQFRVGIEQQVDQFEQTIAMTTLVDPEAQQLRQQTVTIAQELLKILHSLPVDIAILNHWLNEM